MKKVYVQNNSQKTGSMLLLHVPMADTFESPSQTVPKAPGWQNILQ
jgi:hypothetical protein